MIGTSSGTLRYCTRKYRNVDRLQQILALMHRHKWCGVEIIYLKLRQQGRTVNYKQVVRPLHANHV